MNAGRVNLTMNDQLVFFTETYKYRNLWIPMGTRMIVISKLEKFHGVVYNLKDAENNYYYDIPSNIVSVDNFKMKDYNCFN